VIINELIARIASTRSSVSSLRKNS